MINGNDTVNEALNAYNNARLSEIKAVYDNYVSKIELLTLLNMKVEFWSMDMSNKNQE